LFSTIWKWILSLNKNSNAFFIAFNFLHSLQTRQYTRDPQNWDECHAGPELLPLAMCVRFNSSYSVHLFFFLIWQQPTHGYRIHGGSRDYDKLSFWLSLIMHRLDHHKSSAFLTDALTTMTRNYKKKSCIKLLKYPFIKEK